MAEHNDHSFKKMNLKEKTITIIGILLLIILVIGSVFGIYFFGFVAVFQLLGIHYHSNWSLTVFVVCFFTLGLLADLFFDVLTKLVVDKVTGIVKAFIIQMLFGFASNGLILFTVDAFMESISLSLKTKFFIAMLLAILEPIFDNKKGSS